MENLIILMMLVFAAIILLVLLSAPKLDQETRNIIDLTLEDELPELITGQTGFALSNNVPIWYELIKPETQAKGTVCLLMSNAADGLMWPPSFINRFISARYQVIRLDYRGTGQSDWIVDWNKQNAYSLKDMSDDVIAVMDTVNLSKVHLLGFSLGGMIAQELAIQHPQRVTSLTLMMTSGDATDPTMKVFSTPYLISSFLKSLPIMKYRIFGGERNLIIERILKLRLVLGKDDFDVKETAHQVLYDLRNRKGINIKAVFQHMRAVAISGSRYEPLKEIKIPTLIIHGTDDKMLPWEHGKKLLELIPGATSLWLEGVGHVLPFPNMDQVLDRVIEHMDSV